MTRTINFNEQFFSNDLGVPILDITKQCSHVEYPFDIWGRENRSKKGIKTMLFYCEDYRFSHIIQRPEILIEKGIVNAAEINYSVHTNMPFPLALYQTFKKRYVSRYMQEMGLNIMVDLNVPPVWQEMNIQGVPDGWNSYICRGYDEVEWIIAAHDTAKRKSGKDYPNMVIYGGNQETRNYCQKNGIVYLKDVQITNTREK